MAYILYAHYMFASMFLSIYLIFGISSYILVLHFYEEGNLTWFLVLSLHVFLDIVGLVFAVDLSLDINIFETGSEKKPIFETGWSSVRIPMP